MTQTTVEAPQTPFIHQVAKILVRVRNRQYTRTSLPRCCIVGGSEGSNDCGLWHGPSVTLPLFLISCHHQRLNKGLSDRGVVRGTHIGPQQKAKAAQKLTSQKRTEVSTRALRLAIRLRISRNRCHFADPIVVCEWWHRRSHLPTSRNPSWRPSTPSSVSAMPTPYVWLDTQSKLTEWACVDAHDMGEKACL